MTRAENYLRTLGRTPKTVSTYRYAIKRYEEVAGDDLSVDSYTKFLLMLRNHSPATQAVWKSALMGLYRFAEFPDMARLESLNEHYLTREGQRVIDIEYEKIADFIVFCNGLLNDLAELRDRAFVFTLADTGLRMAEACALRRGDIRRGYAVIIGKGNKEAKVRFSERSLIAIRAYLSERAKLDGASGKPLDSLPMFAQHGISAKNKVRAIKAGGMWRAIKARLDQAGIDPALIRLHDFRHYFVTRAVELKGLKTAKELARHSNIRLTDRYTHLKDKDLDKAYEEIFNAQN